MRRGLALLGVSAASFLALAGGVEAKMVSYEIDGQRYSYSTRNRAQVKEARERMARGSAAARAARSRDEPERASNPLARILTPPGSGQAQAPVVAPAEDTTASLRSGRVPRTQTALESRRSSKPSRAERRRLQQEARAERARGRRELMAKRRELAAEKRRKKVLAAQARKDEAAQRLAAQQQQQQRAADETQAAQVVARSEPAEAAKRTDDPSSTQSVRPAPAKTVSFDLSSGIKTIERTDGTLQEEPFDATAVAKLGLADPVNDKALTDFVDQLRAPAR